MCGTFTIHCAGDWYDYGNNHDSANYCPQVEEVHSLKIHYKNSFIKIVFVPLFPPPTTLLTLPTQESDGDGGMADFPPDSQDVDDPSQPLTDLMLAGDNLVPQPRKVSCM